MPASIFTNNDKPISRREDEGKVGFTPSISPNQRETLTLQQVLRNCRVRPGKRMDEIFVAQEPTFVDFSCRTDFHWGVVTAHLQCCAVMVRNTIRRQWTNSWLSGASRGRESTRQSHSVARRFKRLAGIYLLFDHVNQTGNRQFFGGSSPAASEKTWFHAYNGDPYHSRHIITAESISVSL